MVSNEQKERIAPDKIARAEDGMTVTECGSLFDEMKTAALAPRRSGIAGLVARAYHHADFGDPGGKNFFDQDPKRRLTRPIAIHQRLQRERALSFP